MMSLTDMLNVNECTKAGKERHEGKRKFTKSRKRMIKWRQTLNARLLHKFHWESPLSLSSGSYIIARLQMQP